MATREPDTPGVGAGQGVAVLCHEGLPLRQKGLPFGLKKPKNGTWHGYWECSPGLGERSTPYYTYTIVRPVVSQNRHFARKVCRDCQKALPRGPRYRGFSRPNMPEERLRFHGKAFWQNVRPTAKLSGNAPTPCHTTSKAENSGETLYDNNLDGDNLSSDLRQTFVINAANLPGKAQLLAEQAGEQDPAALGSEVLAYRIDTWQQTAAHCAHPADVRTRMGSSYERRESMPKKRVSPRAPRWSDLLGQAVQAHQAKDWERVERLLGQLQTAPDAPPRAQPSQEVLVWYKLQAAFWAHQAAYWQDRALLSEDTRLSVAQVEAVTRGVLRTMVRRVYESLDAAGAPNPTVHALCRELLAQADGRQLDGLLEEALLELDAASSTVAARKHGA